MTMIDSTLAHQFDKLPPNSIESEMCLIGSLMWGVNEPTIIAEVFALVDDQMFFQADHQILFKCIQRIVNKGQKLDAMILREELLRQHLLDDIGGINYLQQILGSVPSALHAVEYAKVVREKHDLRRALSIANEMIRRVYAPADHDVSGEIIQQAVTDLTKISGGSAIAYHSLGEIMPEVMQQIETGGLMAVPTGFRDYDAATGGIGLGEVVILAARPSMGKSTLAKQFAIRMAMHGVPVGIISREEGRYKIGRNMLASEASVENQKLRTGKNLSPEEWKEIVSAVAKLSDLPIYINDKASTMAEIHAQCALWKQRHGVKMIIVDYLQRIIAPGKSIYEKTTAASTGIADMIRQLECGGLILAQLNRGVEHRDEKRPSLADLRDSGQIEQDADTVIFLHREDYYHRHEPDYNPTKLAELILAKVRDGQSGITVWLESCLRFQTFLDITQPRGSQPEEPPSDCPW